MRMPDLVMRTLTRTSSSSPYRKPRRAVDPRHRRVGGALLGVAVGGALFAPGFGPGFPMQIVVPVAVTAFVSYLAVAVTIKWPVLRYLRIPITVVAGGLAVVETALRHTTSYGLPTTGTLRALSDGFTKSWLLALRSSTPVATEQRFVVFVPLLVLVVGLVATQLGLRRRSPHGMLPILPGIAIGVLAEAFAPLSIEQAAAGVVGYAVAASMVGGPRLSLRPVALLAVATVVGSTAAGWADPLDKPTYSLGDHVGGVTEPASTSTPLDELSERQKRPNDIVFTIRPHGKSIGADRWQLEVLDRFDGKRWSSSDQMRYMGAGVSPPPTPGASSQRFSATIRTNESTTWLPSQHGLERAVGVNTLVDERAGTMLSKRTPAGSVYDIQWSAPQVSGAFFDSAKLDDGGAVGRRLTRLSAGKVPQAVRDVLRKAIGNARPSFQTALLIEAYLQHHFRRTTAAGAPSGTGWSDIVRFLTSKDPAAGSGAAGVQGSGTSEQFAAAFTALARLAGIPARIAVGFRQPAAPQANGQYVVRNRDAMAWPEVAVLGVGWVPMEPMGLPSDVSDSTSGTSITNATNQVREHLPNPTGTRPSTRSDSGAQSFVAVARDWLQVAGLLILVLAVTLLLAIPAAKYARAALRRRRAGSEAVLSAWRETCDLLLDHGIRLDGGMTVRDIADSAADVVDPTALRAIDDLADLVDEAVWSGYHARGHTAAAAWRAADEVRKSLAEWSAFERVTAVLAVHSLRPGRAPLTYTPRP